MQRNTTNIVTLSKTSLSRMELLIIFEKESERICRLPIDTKPLAVKALLDFANRYSTSVRIVY